VYRQGCFLSFSTLVRQSWSALFLLAVIFFFTLAVTAGLSCRFRFPCFSCTPGRTGAGAICVVGKDAVTALPSILCGAHLWSLFFFQSTCIVQPPSTVTYPESLLLPAGSTIPPSLRPLRLVPNHVGFIICGQKVFPPSCFQRDPVFLGFSFFVVTPPGFLEYDG